MGKFINNIVNYINSYSETVHNQYKAFGIFALISYPTYWVIWHYLASDGYENLELRLIAVALSVPLIIFNWWPTHLKKYLGIYWYITICYSLPFLFTFFLLKNNFSPGWTLNTITALVLTIFLVDLIPLLIIFPIGLFLGLSLYYFSNGIPSLPNNWLTILVAYSSVLIFGGMFEHRKHLIKTLHRKYKEQEELTHQNKLLAASIAHELRTPLRAIVSGTKGIKNQLPKLTQTYQIAQSAKLDVPPISPSQLSLVENALTNIETEANSAFTVINILLVNASESEIGKDYQQLSLSHCVEQALSRYPFSSTEKGLVHWLGGDDFKFYGNEVLMMHVIFNLLKNALHYVKAANKGDITLWIEEDNHHHYLHFKDTGTGIAPQHLPFIFDRFYTATTHGTGVGLAFCKNAMKSFGGNITCNSVEGEFAEFIMRFPKLEQTQ